MDAFWATGFMRHAVLAGVFAGVACALAGVFAVLMRLTFIGVCLAHAAFAGGLMALLFGGDPLLGALLASLAAGAVIGPVADRGELSPDTAVGVVFSAMLGLAIFCLGLLPGPKTAGLNLFWGNILTVGRRDLWLLGTVAVAASLAIVVFLRKSRRWPVIAKSPGPAACRPRPFFTAFFFSRGLRSRPACQVWAACSSTACSSIRPPQPINSPTAWAAFFCWPPCSASSRAKEDCSSPGSSTCRPAHPSC